ncbi:MAG: protein translocase subunit SecD [Anaerolineae bacterium]|jgi:preprotein translocase subunit SecD|nr:protein translocase subunit SecD [Anaerolineae bacterium]MBT4308873.1 protein translocase subunit SecD [Anaerolineae bacterium]MBT4458466.1 protein translocase subunit SecD [Anaerolineae bacterium]MBT4843537.1 protein translocase subunit SecD [Anaerolineae bacterium]MBT6322427.1 protein translocase subunit SecD [Anaerolineae bacterium]
MIKNQDTRLLVIIILVAFALWIGLSETLFISNPINGEPLYERNVKPQLGLDLRGGLQVLLEADLPEDAEISAEQMEVARNVIENRTNALGVSENVVQIAGDRRIVGEFPGLEDTEGVIAVIQQTGLLEFVDMGDVRPPAGTLLQTDYALSAEDANADSASEDAPEIYHTVMTGSALKEVFVNQPQTGQFQIAFELESEGSDIFAEYTKNNIGKVLAIVLDKEVISAPTIQSEISGGSGVITGQFDYDSANALVVQLRYGSLPIPLKIVESRIIGPTLGEDSLQRSLQAGLIGIIIVVLFMALYYRLPGMMADISIIFYAIIAFAFFKWIGVTLTLPGIAGFMLSTGSALDANILVFERLKEELRRGRSLRQAFDMAWSRALPSIRDSNAAVLITSIILYWFGSAFGATIVKGFALTLALGVLISLFSSLYITKTLLAIALDKIKVTNYARWFGI